MTPQEVQAIQAQQAAAQSQRQQGGQNPIEQAQAQNSAAQGLGTPPPAQFEYNRNPSSDLMQEHVSMQQKALAEKAQAESMQQGQNGYAGYQADPTATAAAMQQGQQPQQGQDAPHPNTGWAPASEQAHQLNIQLADRIQSGQLDVKTAMIAIQSPEVSPEIKQALSQIIEQAQGGGQQQGGPQVGQPAPQGALAQPQQQGNGLGSVAPQQ